MSSSPKKSPNQTDNVPKNLYRRIMMLYNAAASYKEVRAAVHQAWLDSHITVEEYDEMMEPSMIRSFLSVNRHYF